MSALYVCDRCGQIMNESKDTCVHVETRGFGVVMVALGDPPLDTDFDLCPYCLKEFIKWRNCDA